MVFTDSQPDLNGLSTWRASLARQVEELRQAITTHQAELAQVEEKLALVTKLIDAESRGQVSSLDINGADEAATSLLQPSSQLSRPADLETTVEEILRDAGAPLHISDIRGALLERGVPIPGRGDDANIIVRLRRYDERFTRTARGTYGLAEWGLAALKTTKRKPRRGGSR